MSGLELALALAALAIGLTGTWSPCGFSMIETIGPVGHTGGRRTTLAACATFLPGALAGGVATFWALAAIGGVVHATGPVAYAFAAAIAIGAAVLEARGAPIVPQIRRQLPEHWRRTMPMPLASSLYGALLGLGFTTFVLTFGVWALAAISFALGEPQTGLLVGLAFGVGRALPIVSLAPFAGSSLGARATETMAMRPDLYRAFRVGDAVALTAVAGILAGTAAEAATTEAKPGADPSVASGRLAFQTPKSEGVLLEAGLRTGLPGRHPAISADWVAVRSGRLIRLLDPATLAEIDAIAAGKTNSISLSDDWLAWLISRRGRDRIEAAPISGDGELGDGRLVQRVGRTPHLSPPSVDGSRVAYAIATERRNSIYVEHLNGPGTNRVLRSEDYALTTPALRNDDVAYVRIGKRRQQLMITSVGGGDGFGRSVGGRSRKAGVLWTTALGPHRVYATLVTGKHTRIVSTGR
jgi:hypothetical protein